ncbi:hypothetical protein HK102_004681, partial [Quaeritorhiza haematococci]
KRVCGVCLKYNPKGAFTLRCQECDQVYVCSKRCWRVLMRPIGAGHGVDGDEDQVEDVGPREDGDVDGAKEAVDVRDRENGTGDSSESVSVPSEDAVVSDQGNEAPPAQSVDSKATTGDDDDDDDEFADILSAYDASTTFATPGDHTTVCKPMRRLATSKTGHHEKGVSQILLIALHEKKKEEWQCGSLSDSQASGSENGVQGGQPLTEFQMQHRWKYVELLQSHLEDWNVEERNDWRKAVRFMGRLLVECGLLREESNKLDDGSSTNNQMEEFTLSEIRPKTTTPQPRPTSTRLDEPNVLTSNNKIGESADGEAEGNGGHDSHLTNNNKKKPKKKKAVKSNRGISGLMPKAVVERGGPRPPSSQTVLNSLLINSNREHPPSPSQPPSSDSSPSSPSQKTVEYTLDLISKIESNGFGLWNNRGVCFGRAIFPMASYFNHSCDPNLECIQKGPWMVIKTIKEVHPDEDLTISYIDTKQPLAARRQRLSTEYYFHCRCSRCVAEEKGGEKVGKR